MANLSTNPTKAQNEQAIGAFLKSHGLTDPQIAGVLGNIQVESGFDPTAYNPDDNGSPSAGIVQWHGSRLAAEQAFVEQNGGQGVGDLQTQLNYLWQELSGPYSNSVLTPLKQTTTPTAAATLWDQKYEVSSPASLPQRIANANTIYNGGVPTAPVSGDVLGSNTGGIGGDLSAAGNAIENTVTAPAELAEKAEAVIAWFTNTQNLLRVGYFVLGSALVIVGAAKLFGGSPGGAITTLAAPELAAAKSVKANATAKATNRKAFSVSQSSPHAKTGPAKGEAPSPGAPKHAKP